MSRVPLTTLKLGQVSFSPSASCALKSLAWGLGVGILLKAAA